jgi:hypothetical protein
MLIPRKTLSPSVLSLLFVLVCAAPAAAQQQIQARPIEALLFSVVDPATGQEVASLGRGEALQIRPGQQLRLELVNARETQRSQARHVPANFELEGRNTGLELLRQDPARGTVVVRALQGAGSSSSRPEIGWRVPDRVRLANENLRWGRLSVDLVPVSTGGASWQSQADRAVGALYRGILLREPDAGAAGTREEIARLGYAAAVRHARIIAESRESEIGVYDKGACNQQRLLAMYRHLAGRDADDVDQRRWREQLQRLERGDIAGVVDEMVQSPEFRGMFAAG